MEEGKPNISKTPVNVVMVSELRHPVLEAKRKKNPSAICSYSDPVHVNHREQLCLMKTEVSSTPTRPEM
jgi:hypothetical protein